METKKYIIEIPDNTAWLQWVKVSDKDGHVCFDFKDPEDLTPYTEPDLEAIRKEAYDKGYTDAVYNCPEQCAFLNDVKKEAYQRGHEAGTQETKEVLKDYAEKAYQRGLKAAWDAARKIVLSREDGGLLEYDERKAVFGYGNYFLVLKKCSASEAVEKIRQYEQEQKEIKVWDEVQHKSCNSIKIIVLNKESDVITGIAIEDVPYACKVGEMYINRDVKDWEKTGKHYEIAEVLRKMKEKEA